MTPKLSLILIATSALVGASVVPVAARRTPDVKCRNRIGSSVEGLVRTGFAVLDRCMERHPDGTACANLAKDRYAHATARADGISNYWCSKQLTILQNYPTSDTPGVIKAIGSPIRALLEDSTRSVFPGTASGAGSPAQRRCVRAITRGRSSVASAVLAGAVGCQQALDRHGADFGELSASCVNDATRESARARKKIGRVCSGLSGASVGACDPLPECVLESARATGNELGKTTYGVKSVCGNGKVEPGESCDDGAANSVGGSCTDSCQKASCGDGKVETGVEACDNGKNELGQNFDSDTCTANCNLIVCGNNILEPPLRTPPSPPTRVTGEQCDDGNLDAGDGCSPTCRLEPAPCGADGTLDVTVTFVTDKETFSAAAILGVKLTIGYPTTFSIPGSADSIDPLDPASPVKLLSADPNDINLYDGLVTFYDFDTTPPFNVSTLLSISPTTTAPLVLSKDVPFESVHFGCQAGTMVTEADFPCTIDGMADVIARSLDPHVFPNCVVKVIRGPH